MDPVDTTSTSCAGRSPRRMTAPLPQRFSTASRVAPSACSRSRSSRLSFLLTSDLLPALAGVLVDTGPPDPDGSARTARAADAPRPHLQAVALANALRQQRDRQVHDR